MSHPNSLKKEGGIPSWMTRYKHDPESLERLWNIIGPHYALPGNIGLVSGVTRRDSLIERLKLAIPGDDFNVATSIDSAISTLSEKGVRIFSPYRCCACESDEIAITVPHKRKDSFRYLIIAGVKAVSHMNEQAPWYKNLRSYTSFRSPQRKE